MAKVKNRLTVGSKVLVKTLSLSFSDYKNLAGEVREVHGEFAVVAIPRAKISAEDLSELKRDGDKALAQVKITDLV